MKKPNSRTRGGMAHKPLNYHEGLSANQVNIILTEFGLKSDKFYTWMYGQTCPMVQRYDEHGNTMRILGIYEYDLFRWIENQKKGTPLIWD